MAEKGAILIGALLRRRDAGSSCHRNAPFVFVVDRIGYAHFAFYRLLYTHTRILIYVNMTLPIQRGETSFQNEKYRLGK